MTSQPSKLNVSSSASSASEMEGLKFHIGDYVRWPIRTIVFAADDQGNANPLEMEYAYGIIIAVACGVEVSSDAVIIRSTTLNEWVVAHIDDPEYKFELLSQAQAGQPND